ncbi:MAG: hypothetical protein HY934_08820, partial [Candidatus Firestonebacteria bacterium]|nr:hypothetical protein [Candidatus Firestonebacteria bacterium]
GLNSNRKDRQSNGLVDNSDYERIWGDINYQITNITGENNEKIFINAYKKEEIYNGPFMNNIPDIILELNKKYEAGSDLNNLITDITTTSYKKWSGYHIEDGVFLAKSPITKKNFEIGNANIVDIASTILFSMGMEIPTNMDGKILKDIFASEFITQNKEKYTQLDEQFKAEKNKSISDDEEKEMKNALKGLGYM